MNRAFASAARRMQTASPGEVSIEQRARGMTYCLGVMLEKGMVFASDSRTNAGVDNFAKFCKMTVFERRGDRVIVLGSSGNLAGTQAVIGVLNQRCAAGAAAPNLWSARTMFDVAMLVADAMRDIELYEPSVRMRYVSFPTTSMVSLLYVMEDGASAEIAIVGNEGVLGVSLFMGGDTTPSRAVVQSAGIRLPPQSSVLKDEFGRFGPTMHLLLRYTQALITQMAQTAVCNRHHSVDQQLCRWLLLSLDRLQSNELSMTQELIANMLGVRHEGVTEAAGKLQNAGLIRYQRGRITVLDRPGVEARSCECYQVVKTEFDRLLPYALV